MFNPDDISPDLKEKAKQCETVEELVALAKGEGIELSDEMLSEISGGDDWYTICSDYCSIY